LTSIAEALRAEPLLGPAVYWIVPKQATFMAERMLTCALGAFARGRVVSFEQLGREIFSYAGGNVIPEVTPLGRQLVIGHLLRQLKPQLKFFASSARQPGLALELDAAFAEFERSGRSPADLDTLIDDLDTSKPADVDAITLLAKLRDIRLVYAEYAKYLGQDRLDQHRRLEQVLGCLDGCPPLRGATVYVDGFTTFTDFERRLLAGLGKVAAHVQIALLLDPKSAVLRDRHAIPDDGSPFHQTEQTYRKLHFAFSENGVLIDSPVLLDKVYRFTEEALERVEAETFSDRWQPRAEARGIELVVTPDRPSEVDAVARRIRALWREGVRFREIGVLTRDIDAYQPLIDSSFREHGVTYFVDRRRSAIHHPLLQFVRSFLQIGRYDWPNEPVIALLKTGLAGVTPDEADAVENYVEQHRIRGVAWESAEPWTYRRKLTLEVDDATVDESSQSVDDARRRVVDLLRPSITLIRVEKTLTVREFAKVLFAVLDRFQIPETLATWASRSDEDAAEHGQVWAEFVDLCEQMVDLLGDERMSLADFIDVLESGLERFDLALTPPTVDQVLVGQVDRTRCPEVKAVFVLGLNDGEFPRVAREPSVLTDTERREMRRRHVELDPNRRGRLRDEDLLGYVAFTRASQRFIASRPRNDDNGRATNPSRYWRRLLAMFMNVEPLEVPRDAQKLPQFIETPRQVISAVMNWARSQQQDAGVWASVYQWLTGLSDGAVAKLRECSWPAVGYLNGAVLSSKSAEELFGVPLEATARQLETFATCPFKHFVRFGLGIVGKSAPGVTGLDLSEVYHKVLDIVVAEALEKRADWQQLTSVVTPKTIRDYSQAIGQTLRGELMLSTARNKYLLNRVERTLEEVVASQTELMRRGQMRPAFTSVEFGEQGRVPALRVRTPKGRELLMHGSIDRVDLLPDDKHVAVYDYKLSAGPLSMQEVYHGLSLQLLTYLLVLQANGADLAGKPLTPVAAFYLPLLRRYNDVDHPDEALDPADPKYHLRVKPRGVFNSEYLPAFDAQLDHGASEVIAAYVKKDGTLGHRSASDVAEPAEFAALLAFVEQRLGQLADDVLSGRIDIAPYRMGQVTPCPRCEYRAVCRFEPSVNRYNNLQSMRREDVLVQLAQNQQGGRDAD
jgi:ATP-dependent helicase/nuclease subunit B